MRASPEPTSRAVFLGAELHLVGGNACGGEQLGPDPGGLGVLRDAVRLVTAEAGDVDPVRIQADLLGQEGPELVQLLVFEVVTQAPVAEHLEEGGVPVVADLFDVLHPQAGLAVGQPMAGRMVGAEQVGQQRLHATAGEQRGGIVLGDQRSPGNDNMPLLDHEFEVDPTDLDRRPCGHDRSR